MDPIEVKVHELTGEQKREVSCTNCRLSRKQIKQETLEEERPRKADSRPLVEKEKKNTRE